MDPRLDNVSEKAWEEFHAFCDEARKLRVLVEQLSMPLSPGTYDALLNHHAAEKMLKFIRGLSVVQKLQPPNLKTIRELIAVPAGQWTNSPLKGEDR
jgi:hypothetical protein